MRKREAEKMQEMERVKEYEKKDSFKAVQGALFLGFPTAARLWRGFPVFRDKHTLAPVHYL